MAGRPELKINSGFAQKYDKYRQKEELQRRPAISDEKASTSKKAVKPMFLKDYERKVILEKEGKYEDDDDSDDEEAARRMDERASSPSYIQEQRQLRDRGKDFVEWLKDKTDLEGPEEVKDLDDVEDSEEEGESFLERQEDFERKYNFFRYEEPDAARVKTYPRSIATSVRTKDDSRKLKRDEKFFGDEYYGGAEDEKPQFEADEELEEKRMVVKRKESITPLGRTATMRTSLWMQTTTPASRRPPREKEEGEEDDEERGFATIGQKEEKYLDEYYKLDYEDIDDLPCRFRYRQVLPNDFGLSTEEILHADDKELNQWASLKKTCMFRSDKEESSDLHNYKIKAKNVKRKKEILSSVYSETEEAESTSIMDSTEETLVTLKEAGDNNEEEEEVLIPKKKMKQEEESQVAAAEKPVEVRNRTERTKWPKAKLKSSAGRRPSSGGLAGVRIGGREFSQQRLKAYGLNPKRLFFRQLGRQRRKDQEKMDKQKNKEPGEDGQGVRRHLRNIPAVRSCALSVEDISHPQN
ncbi:hypothetical protein F7725_003934, partial [Dissostichus mawsoni]